MRTGLRGRRWSEGRALPHPPAPSPCFRPAPSQTTRRGRPAGGGGERQNDTASPRRLPIGGRELPSVGACRARAGLRRCCDVWVDPHLDGGAARVNPRVVPGANEADPVSSSNRARRADLRVFRIAVSPRTRPSPLTSGRRRRPRRTSTHPGCPPPGPPHSRCDPGSGSAAPCRDAGAPTPAAARPR